MQGFGGLRWFKRGTLTPAAFDAFSTRSRRPAVSNSKKSGHHCCSKLQQKMRQSSRNKTFGEGWTNCKESECKYLYE
jgi:hypothetical protein